jgi:hypothetical protein
VEFEQYVIPSTRYIDEATFELRFAELIAEY